MKIVSTNLKKRVKANLFKPRNNLCWPEVYFAAEADNEEFEDVKIVTLKSYLVDKAHDIAISDHNFVVGVDSDTTLRSIVGRILNTDLLREAPHVDVSAAGILVVMDCEIIDDDTIFPALDMVLSALKKLNGAYGIITFGPTVSYSATEIAWMNLH
jgi:hypothetical protein